MALWIPISNEILRPVGRIYKILHHYFIIVGKWIYLFASILGQTPEKRMWQYPQQLAAMSPHERLLQRFWKEKRVIHIKDDFQTEVSCCTYAKY